MLRPIGYEIYAPTPRQKILKRVRDGEITPEQAEAEAAKLGLKPLARTPGPTALDPMREVWWTLAMAAAWIVWRTPHAVRRVWPAYLFGIWEWYGPIVLRIPVDQPQTEAMASRRLAKGTPESFRDVKSYRLMQRTEPALDEVFLRAAKRLPSYGPVKVAGGEAHDDLWRKLQGGELIAEGIERGQSKRASIRRVEWIDLGASRNNDWPVGSVGISGEDFERYKGVHVERVCVNALWPAAGAPTLPEAAGAKPGGVRLAVKAAYAELFHDVGIPLGMTIKQRDAKIAKWFETKGLNAPGARTIHRSLTTG